MGIFTVKSGGTCISIHHLTSNVSSFQTDTSLKA